MNAQARAGNAFLNYPFSNATASVVRYKSFFGLENTLPLSTAPLSSSVSVSLSLSLCLCLSSPAGQAAPTRLFT